MSEQIIFWLRAETKDSERRTPLTPNGAKSLIDKGAKVFVEKSSDRIFPDSSYEEIGCELVSPGTWRIAPHRAYILGLKELPEDEFALEHRHIYFAHVYKGQDGARDLLMRFQSGKGELYDLEYLIDDNKRRVAAFGHWAGFVGAAIAVDSYYYHQLHPKLPYPPLHSFLEQDELILQIKTKQEQANIHPKVIIIGAKGRCGGGSLELVNSLGLEATCWDYEETAIGGPFKQIPEHHIFVNAVLIQDRIPPFLDESVLSKTQNLKVIADVSCDPYGDMNPIPLYNRSTTWEEPLLNYDKNEINLNILAVDNLPSILPKESSEDFSAQLLPHLEDLTQKKGAELTTPWKSSLETFQEHLNSL